MDTVVLNLILVVYLGVLICCYSRHFQLDDKQVNEIKCCLFNIQYSNPPPVSQTSFLFSVNIFSPQLAFPTGKQYPYNVSPLAYIPSGYWAKSKPRSTHDWWGNGILIQLLSRHPAAICAHQPSLFGNLPYCGQCLTWRQFFFSPAGGSQIPFFSIFLSHLLKKKKERKENGFGFICYWRKYPLWHDKASVHWIPAQNHSVMFSAVLMQNAFSSCSLHCLHSLQLSLCFSVENNRPVMSSYGWIILTAQVFTCTTNETFCLERILHSLHQNNSYAGSDFRTL